MELTKKEAVRRHRLMWNWIAQTSIQEQRVVTKEEAFEHFGWNKFNVSCHCWCCDYAEQVSNTSGETEIFSLCHFCPICWPAPWYRCSVPFGYGLFDKFCRALDRNDYILAAKCAYEIAEFPERKD